MADHPRFDQAGVLDVVALVVFGLGIAGLRALLRHGRSAQIIPFPAQVCPEAEPEESPCPSP